MTERRPAASLDAAVAPLPAGAAAAPRSWGLLTVLGRSGFSLVGVLTQGVVIIVAYRMAYELRFDFVIPPEEVRRFWATLPLLVMLRLAAYTGSGVFRAYWQHFGTRDLLTLAHGATLSAVAFAAALIAFGELPGMPRSVLLIDWGGAIFLGGGVPFLARCLREGLMSRLGSRGARTLVVGVGESAEQLLREASRESTHPIHVVGLVDPGGTHQGRAIRGVRVLGTLDSLPTIAARTGTELVVIALEGVGPEEMQRVVERCLATGVDFQILPSLHELLADTAGVKQLRPVRLEDLLGRKPVRLELSHVHADLCDRVVLVTGAAGSIGSELARQIARFRPLRLILLDQAESELYVLHMELLKSHPSLDLQVAICDITDESRVAHVFAEHRPEYVIHAAAYKHVPLMESHVVEAVRNNVLGTLLIATAAAAYGARKMLLISTDKAINPSSVMGATKRIAERIIFGFASLRESTIDFRAVRFGNVLGSNGSVVPVFERQLAAGGPLTVTHPDVERYFMTVGEAVQLVLQAGSLPEAAGCISMLEMGKPVRILDLAEKLIRLSGRVPGKSVPIVFTGLRPGEKLREDLASTLEATVPTSAESVRLSQCEEQGGAVVERALARLFALTAVGDRVGLLAAICEVVPECVPPLRDWATSDARQRARLQEGHSLNGDHTGSGSRPDAARGGRGLLQTSRFSPITGWPALRAGEWLEQRREQGPRRQTRQRSGGRRRSDVRASLGRWESASMTLEPPRDPVDLPRVPLHVSEQVKVDPQAGARAMRVRHDSP
jgi:FlaA1/EpsC-like NDP-sugar epimerase